MGLNRTPATLGAASDGAKVPAKIADEVAAGGATCPREPGAAMSQLVCSSQDAMTSEPHGARKPDPVVTPVDLSEVLFPHERSPDATTQKRAFTSVVDGHMERPCEKKLKREQSQQLQERVLSPLDLVGAEEIRQHLRDVRREVFLRPMIAIVTRLMFHKYNHGLFNVRVDPIEWNIPHYFEVVKNPMDLTLVKTKCLNLEYASAEDCAADIRLVFSNACLFNPPGHMVHECATLLAKEFDVEYTRYQAKRDAQAKRRDEHSCPSCLANVCAICDEKCINFEPPLVMCSGPCKQRIKRHSVYYKTPDRAFHWCAKCYTTLPKSISLMSSSASSDDTVGGYHSVPKQSLVKAKFVDELTEPWVQCDCCNGWVHQICALFNACENPEDDEDEVMYMCPLCRLKILDSDSSWSIVETTPSETSVEEFPMKILPDMLSLGSRQSSALLNYGEIPRSERGFASSPVKSSASDKSQKVGRSSADLASSPLSKFMQKWVRDYLNKIGEFEIANSIEIKLSSSIKSTCQVSQAVREEFSSSKQKYPERIDYTSKAIFVFQRIHGVEVCIFSMYVQEYDECASLIANRNRTYIAYIDSLVYMRPRHIRTRLFHEILISYLGFCKMKGFEYAHIWACPTTRGGDFIYWCHPSFQKNPGKDRLLQWYMAMAEKAKKANVAFSVDDLYSTDFERLEEQLESRLPPFFDGDYWGSEVERLRANPPKRGKLSKEAYEESLHGVKFRKKLVESVRQSRDSLFVIGLQPRCSMCDRLVVNSECWARTTPSNTTQFFCDECVVDPDAALLRVHPPSFMSDVETQDDKLEISCPFLNHRADMLKNCEEQHLQFDSFRRAKYSTMMLVYHMSSARKVRTRA